jgi:DNA repair exonuclease SbcCD ATPase subunit
LGTKDDIFPIAATRAAVADARRIFATLGVPEKLGFGEFEGERQFWGKGAFSFLGHWLWSVWYNLESPHGQTTLEEKENRRMWDESTRHRFQDLRRRELDGTLGEAERIELAQRVQELEDFEAARLAPALKRLRRDNLQLQAEVEELAEQRQQLERLIEEKEAFLARAHTFVEELEAERLDLLDRFARIVGEPLLEAEPASTSP